MKFFFQFLKRFPFDTTNPIGYSVAVLLEYGMCAYELFIVACTLSLGIGAFWFAISATTQFQHYLPMINDKASTGVNGQSHEFKILFSAFIDSHGVVKQLSIFHYFSRSNRIEKYFGI